MSNNAHERLKAALIRAMGSEHTSYKSTSRYLKTLPTEGPYVIQGPGENAGIISLGGGLAIALRIESHNHPSFINPREGAATGVGGILRDIFTMGARPIALMDFLRFGTDKNAERLRAEVVRGISAYGNCVGVPVVGGDVFHDPTYDHNCLVNVCAAGLMPESQIIYGNALTAGSDLIYVGARTGRDGIGGAEMASQTLDAPDENAVQKSDPFLEKLLLEACLELAGTGWIEGMQDMGAAGLLCSTTEVVRRGAKKTGKSFGAEIFLDRVPRKAEGMSAEELLLSESQERMLIVGKPEHRDDILAVFRKWDLETVAIGRVTEDGLYTLHYKNEDGAEECAAFPLEEILKETEQEWGFTPWKPQRGAHRAAPPEVIRDIWHQYDFMVGTRTVKGPDQPGAYAVLSLDEIGKELVLTWSSDRGLANVHPYFGMEFAISRCYVRMCALDAEPRGMTNCLNFGHPMDSMGAFVESVLSLSHHAALYRVPVVSGNVSLYNAHGMHSIKPTPVIVMAGVRDKPV